MRKWSVQIVAAFAITIGVAPSALAIPAGGGGGGGGGGSCMTCDRNWFTGHMSCIDVSFPFSGRENCRVSTWTNACEQSGASCTTTFPGPIVIY